MGYLRYMLFSISFHRDENSPGVIPHISLRDWSTFMGIRGRSMGKYHLKISLRPV